MPRGGQRGPEGPVDPGRRAPSGPEGGHCPRLHPRDQGGGEHGRGAVCLHRDKQIWAEPIRGGAYRVRQAILGFRDPFRKKLPNLKIMFCLNQRFKI